MIVGSLPLLLKARAQVPQDFLAHYTFDNVSGTTIFDESANSYDMTTFNSPTFAAGVDGDQIETSAASSQYAEVAIPELDSMTVGTLLFFADADIGGGSGNRCVMGVGNAASAAAQLRISSAGVLNWTISVSAGNTKTADGSTDISSGKHMLSISSNGVTTSASVDGSPESLVFSLGSNDGSFFGDMAVNSQKLGVAIFDRSDGPFYYNSGIDELYLYERVLTSSELSAIYNTYI